MVVGREKLFACSDVWVRVGSNASQHFILLSGTLYYIFAWDIIRIQKPYIELLYV